MNVADLEAELPALTVALLTGVDAVGQVATADRAPTVRRADTHVIWTLVEDVAIPDAGGLGRTMHGLRYTASIRGPAATQARRRLWAEELRAGLHQRRRPVNVAGLDHAEVLGFSVTPVEGVGVPGGQGAAQAEADVLFVGDVELS